MRKRTEKKIASALKRWSSLKEKRDRVEAKREKSLQPLRERFEEQCAPIHARALATLEPIEKKMREVENEITAVMLSGIDEKGGIEFKYIDTATAVAEVITREERELDAKTFFDSVPASQRGSAFYSCLKTYIGKAEKFLGANRLNELCHMKRSHSVSIKTK